MVASTNIYDYPQYYEIAFSFRNISREVAFFDEAIRRFSRIPVRTVLELACGTSPYLEEWHRRSITYLGLDKNPKMLTYSRQRAVRRGISARFFRKNMIDFTLPGQRADLAYVLVGSLFCKSNDDLFRHLDCVGSVLRRGGLYVLDSVVWFNFFDRNPQEWQISRKGITVSSSWDTEIIDPPNQLFRDKWILQVKDGKNKFQLGSNQRSRFFFPQEFLALIRLHNKFHFLRWFDNFDIVKQPQLNSRPTIVLRRK